MTTLGFLSFAEMRRRRCDCCDRTMPLTDKVLLVRDSKLLGDLELCPQCARALKEALNNNGGRDEMVQDE